MKEYDKMTAVKQVIQNPHKLAALDIKKYEEELK